MASVSELRKAWVAYGTACSKIRPSPDHDAACCEALLAQKQLVDLASGIAEELTSAEGDYEGSEAARDLSFTARSLAADARLAKESFDAVDEEYTFIEPASFERLVIEIAQGLPSNCLFEPAAIAALQRAAEEHLVEVLALAAATISGLQRPTI